jgi:glycosyltransferase involved in cell wall biosynthesis
MKPTVGFFVQTIDHDLVNRNEFYKIDIKILEDLGFNVQICHSYKNLPTDVTFYFIWWWTYAIFPVMKAKRLRKKCIITGTFNLARHISGADYYSRPFYQKFLIKSSARLANMNIMVSNYEFEKMKNEITRNNVCYSPHVLDIDKYFTQEKSNRNKSVLTIAWMGDKNARRKCIPEIIKAAAILKSRGVMIPFIICGKVEEDASFLKKMIEELDVSDLVNFPGPVDEETKLELLNMCGIYLQPTLFEGFGVAIAEALLCGAPVITSKVGAVNELTNGNCTYVDGESPEEIADNIIKVFDNYNHYLDLALKGSEFVKQNYYLDRRKNDFKKILENLDLLK